MRLRKTIGACLMVAGAVCFLIGILAAFAAAHPAADAVGGFLPLGIALAVLGALANVVGLFLPFSRRIGD
ncbi:MAG: hypothetical protein WD716_10920 [Fimbriimonadaceae bacterium]